MGDTGPTAGARGGVVRRGARGGGGGVGMLGGLGIGSSEQEGKEGRC